MSMRPIPELREAWATLGAVPEMLQTAHGSLTVGLDARPGQSLLILGAGGGVGLMGALADARVVVLANVAPWVLQILLGLYFVAIGIMHFVVPDSLPDRWTEMICSKPASASDWYTALNAPGEGREVFTGVPAARARGSSRSRSEVPSV